MSLEFELAKLNPLEGDHVLAQVGRLADQGEAITAEALRGIIKDTKEMAHAL